MCSFELVAVLQAFSVSDLSPDWKPAITRVLAVDVSQQPPQNLFLKINDLLATPFSLPGCGVV